jgi:hypothetical protein
MIGYYLTDLIKISKILTDGSILVNEFKLNPDIENKTLFPFCHCEHLEGAWQSH